MSSAKARLFIGNITLSYLKLVMHFKSVLPSFDSFDSSVVASVAEFHWVYLIYNTRAIIKFSCRYSCTCWDSKLYVPHYCVPGNTSSNGGGEMASFLDGSRIEMLCYNWGSEEAQGDWCFTWTTSLCSWDAVAAGTVLCTSCTYLKLCRRAQIQKNHALRAMFGRDRKSLCGWPLYLEQTAVCRQNMQHVPCPICLRSLSPANRHRQPL